MGFDMFTQFHFLRPWWLMTILPVLLFVRFFFGTRRIRSRWRGVIEPHLLDHLVISGGLKKRIKPTHMLVVASVLASVAMAGPTWHRSISPFAEDRAPLAVVLDLSKSMDQADIQPTRLKRAKQKVRDLMALRGGSKTGVIVYSGSSHTVIPLTNDPQVIENLLVAVNSDMMPRRGKSMEKALPLVQKMFREQGIPGTILLITDGVPEKARAAFVQFCEASGHQLIVYGVGSRQHERPESGNNGIFGGALIPLAQKELQTLAKDCNGVYIDVTPDKSDINRIRRRIDFNFVSAKDQTRPWIDSGYFLLFPIAAVFVLWFRKGWTLTWGIVLITFALFAGPGPAAAGDKMLVDMWLTPDQQGRYYVEKGDYGYAAECFENIFWKGAAFYLDENFEAAIEMFLQIETPEGYFNLANAYAHARHYGKAVDAYHRVPAVNPRHDAAIKNLGIIKRVIDEINAVSAAQKGEPGEAVEQLGDDSAEAAGALQVVFGKKDGEFFTAEQILNNPDLNEIWMRQVQQDPARFLRMKFQMQLNRQTQEKTLHGK